MLLTILPMGALATTRHMVATDVIGGSGGGTATATADSAESHHRGITALQGDIVTVTATANPGHRFVRWDTTGFGVHNFDDRYSLSTFFTMPGMNIGIVPVFEQVWAVTVNVNAAGRGTAEANPTLAALGESVALTAAPAAGYDFVRWDGTGSINLGNWGGDPLALNTSFNMPAWNVALTAMFAPDLTALLAAIAAAELRIPPEHYTPATWTAMQNALTTARNVRDDINATASQVTAATTALNNAVNTLAVQPDRDLLTGYVLTALNNSTQLLNALFGGNLIQNIIEGAVSEFLDPAAIVDMASPMLTDLIQDAIANAIGIALPDEIVSALVSTILENSAVTDILNSNFVGDVLDAFISNILSEIDANDLLAPVLQSLANVIADHLWNNGNPLPGTFNPNTGAWTPGGLQGITLRTNAWILANLSTLGDHIDIDINDILAIIPATTLQNAAIAAVTTVAGQYAQNWINQNQALINAVIGWVNSIVQGAQDAQALLPYMFGIIEFILNDVAFVITATPGTNGNPLYTFTIAPNAALVALIDDFLEMFEASTLGHLTAISEFADLMDRIRNGDELPFLLNLLGGEMEHGWHLNLGAPELALVGNTLVATGTLTDGIHHAKVSYRVNFTFPWLDQLVSGFEIVLTLATESVTVDVEDSTTPDPTVAVGAQVGTMTAGLAGTVTFPVTTANIPNSTYTVTVANLPSGVSIQGQVTINNGSGTLTLAGSVMTLPAVHSTLTLTLDGVTSDPFILTIVSPLINIPPAGQPPTQPGVYTYAYHEAYMFGNERGEFRPRANTTRAEVAAILVRTMIPSFRHGTYPSGTVALTGFSDVTQANWFYWYVVWAQAAGLVQGDANGAFRPNAPITRQEYAAMVARLGNVRPAGNFTFGDRGTISNWARNYVYTAVRNGWMMGDGGNNFRPSDNITRAEVATATNRILGRIDSQTALAAANLRNPADARSFPDVSGGAWYFASVLGAANDHRNRHDGAGTIVWKEVLS